MYQSCVSEPCIRAMYQLPHTHHYVRSQANHVLYQINTCIRPPVSDTINNSHKCTRQECWCSQYKKQEINTMNNSQVRTT